MKSAEVSVPTADGETVARYTVWKFSPLDGREILAGYPLAILGSEHTYAKNAEAMRSLLRYCSVEVNGEHIHLIDDALINAHVPDWWALVQLEFECIKFNCSFLRNTDLFEAARESITNTLRNMLAEKIGEVK